MMLQFPDSVKLKTKKLLFKEAYAARDFTTLEQMKELSSKRRVIEVSINESSSITKAIEREISNLISSNDLMLWWTSNLKIQWTSAVSSSSSFFNLKGPRFFQIDNLRLELGMTLFLFGAILLERALEALPADLVQSATFFREAAGVYHHLANEVLPSLQHALLAEKPPKVVSSVSTIMSLICLVETQAITIRKAEQKVIAISFLAKLHQGVTQLPDEADVISKECKDISSRFVEFILTCKAIDELRSQKYLAESVRIAGQVGVAVGVLRLALINIKKKMPVEESWKSVFRKEIYNVSELLRKFEHENEFVWHEKIASGDELPLPQGKKIVSIIPYNRQKWESELVFKI